MRIKNLLSWLILVVLLAALALGITKAQAIDDWLKLRSYEPSSRVVQLADHTTMTDGTRRVFYVNHPSLDSKEAFNTHCSSAEQTIVLGCFIENRGIFLLDVEDKRLSGVVEVTAAHEVLHAMYERLSASERQRVDRMTNEFFQTLDNDRIKKTIENYRKKDPTVVPNELHSILGTEVSELSPELETYYAQYFSDRQKIVEYSDKYEEVFTDIETKAESYDTELAALKQKIEQNKTEINAKGQEIDGQQRKLDSLLAANQIEEYNNQIPAYNNLVNNYNRLVNETKQAINSYNRVLNERNTLVIQQQELYKAIDSNSISEK